MRFIQWVLSLVWATCAVALPQPPPFFPDQICHQTSLLQGPPVYTAASNFSRIVVVGDVHGSLVNLLSVLHAAGVVASKDDESCRWGSSESARNLLLVQTGDVVDRGPRALESWRCLQALQRAAPLYGSRVVRLIGNHELLWLQGETHYKNKREDTPDRVAVLTAAVRDDIQSGAAQACFSFLSFKALPLFFSHAGLRPQLLRQMQARTPARTQAPDTLAALANDKLRLDVQRCPPAGCIFRDAIYGVGSERGGRDIGGLFWTDFSVLTKAAAEQVSAGTGARGLGTEMSLGRPESGLGLSGALAMRGSESIGNPNPGPDPFGVWPVVQVVGHSLELGSIRATEGLLAVCVDVGLYLGGQGFLEVLPTGHFWAHEKEKAQEKWAAKDLTSIMCRGLQSA